MKELEKRLVALETARPNITEPDQFYTQAEVLAATRLVNEGIEPSIPLDAELIDMVRWLEKVV